MRGVAANCVSGLRQATRPLGSELLRQAAGTAVMAELGGPDLSQMEPGGRLAQGGRGLLVGRIAANLSSVKI